MVRRLQLFLASVAAVLWMVSYWAQLHIPAEYGTSWFGMLSAFTFLGAVVATSAVVIIQVAWIVDPPSFNE